MKLSMQRIYRYYVQREKTSAISKTQVSFLLNCFISLFKCLIGILYDTKWMLMCGSYFMMLAVARGHVLYKFNKSKSMNCKIAYDTYVHRVYHRSGYFIIGIGISYMLLCFWMYRFDEQISYPQYIVYGVVAIAFYKIGMAIYGLCDKKNDHSVLLSILKIINLMDASVSIVASQCALLVSQHSIYASKSSAMLGIGCSIMCIAMGCIIVQKKV